MHKILFKAKLKNWKENPKKNLWVEGSLLVLDWESDYVFIMKEVNHASTLPLPLLIDRNCFLVDKETICQYTGLKDKDGNRIWENDILRLENGAYLKVSWHTFKASWVISKKGWMYNHFFGEGVEPEDVKVSGNAFDNPELLERS